MNVVTLIEWQAGLRPFPPDLIIGRFFFVGFTVFAFVRVLLDGSQRLKRLDASFLLARIFRCLVLSVTDWV